MILTGTDCGWKQNLRLFIQDAISKRKILSFLSKRLPFMPDRRENYRAFFLRQPRIMAQRQRIRLAAFLRGMLFCLSRFPGPSGKPFKHAF